MVLEDGASSQGVGANQFCEDPFSCRGLDQARERGGDEDGRRPMATSSEYALETGYSRRILAAQRLTRGRGRALPAPARARDGGDGGVPLGGVFKKVVTKIVSTSIPWN